MKKTYIIPSVSVVPIVTNSSLLLGTSIVGGDNNPGNGIKYEGQDGVSVGAKEDSGWDLFD